MTDDQREFDTTALKSSAYAMRIHRDYLAHVFRWGWASRYINQGATAAHRVIEAGCGADAPLYHALNRPRGADGRPDLYVGVDLNTIPSLARRRSGTKTEQKFILKEKFNFVTQWSELLEEYGATFDMAVSFEVIEHMTESHGDEYLRGIHALLAPGGRLMISTPVFNGRAANNHIREYTIAELQDKLQKNGFGIQDRYGTFGSYPELKRGIHETFSSDKVEVIMEVYSRLRSYYSDDVLACFLAPALPDYSRNNAWIAVKE